MEILAWLKSMTNFNLLTFLLLLCNFVVHFGVCIAALLHNTSVYHEKVNYGYYIACDIIPCHYQFMNVT